METSEKKSTPTASTTSVSPELAKMETAEPLPAKAFSDVTASKQAMKISALIEVDEEELDRDFDVRITVPNEHKSRSIAQIFAKYGLKHAADDIYARPKPQVERVERKPRIRVHYICHECNTTFGYDRTCKGCTHQRCRDCTRYPPKKSTKDKAKTKRSLAVPKSIAQPSVTAGPCHECQTEFTIGDSECANCHHKICKKCLAEAVENTS